MRVLEFVFKCIIIAIAFTLFGEETLNAQKLLGIQISDNLGATRTLEFGFHENATEGYDSGIDLIAPPLPPSGILDVRFPGVAFDLFKDVRPFSSNETFWTISIIPNHNAETITVQWDFNHQYVSRGAYLIFGGSEVSMREQQNITLNAVSQTISIRFEPPLESESTLLGSEGFRLFSAPFRWMHIRDVTEGLWTQGFPNAGTAAGDPNVFYWDEAGFFVPATDGFAEIEPGKGMTVFVYEDDNFDGIPDGFPKVLNHLGYLRMNEVQVPVQWSGNEPQQGWNLVGNPYELPLDLSLLESGMDYSNMASFYYVWIPEADENNGAYLVFDQGGAFIPGISFDGVIQPSQAFWLRSTGANPELVLKRDHLDGGRGRMLSNQSNALTFTINAEGFTGRTAIVISDEERNSIPFLAPLRADWLELATHDLDTYTIIRYINLADTEEIVIPMDVLTTLSGMATLSYSLAEEALYEANFMLCDVIQQECYELSVSGEIHMSLDHQLKRNSTSTIGNMISPIVNLDKGASRFEVIIQPKSTSVDAHRELPESVMLSQNYPNPFNPQTVIEFALPFESKVVLEVFTLQGRRVATLINEVKPSGSHLFTFDATHLPSGVYFYRLQAGTMSVVKKMTLLK